MGLEAEKCKRLVSIAKIEARLVDFNKSRVHEFKEKDFVVKKLEAGTLPEYPFGFA